MSIWPSEMENLEDPLLQAFFSSFLRKQESRIWTPDQVRGDGVVLANRTKILAIVICMARPEPFPLTSPWSSF